MFGNRGKIDVETLVRIVLLLLVAILALRLAGYILSPVIGIVGDVLVLLIVVLLLLYFLDEI